MTLSRIRIQRQIINMQDCTISPPVTQDVTNCAQPICGNCLIGLANQTTQGSIVLSASGSTLLDGIIGVFNVAGNPNFPGHAVVNFGANRTVTSGIPATLCGLSIPVGTTELYLQIVGFLYCAPDDLTTTAIMTGGVSINVSYKNAFGGVNALCTEPFLSTSVLSPPVCVNPFNLAVPVNIDDAADSNLGTGTLTVTFAQTFP